MYCRSITELVGSTPLLEPTNYNRTRDARILCKLEGFNPAGSAKDRVALMMILDAEARGILRTGGTIIEPTSGNTGIGLAAIGVPRGYRVILVMPDTMSIERRKLLSAYGAEIHLSEGSKGMQGAIEMAKELAAKIEGSFIPSQFDNPANPKAHEATTARELLEETGGHIDILVAGVGTGGTITGVGEYLKSKKDSIKIVAVEPRDSAVLSGECAGAHKLQGIGAGFVPEVLNTDVYDEIIKVASDDAYEAARLVGKREGVLVGISSGAALHAAIEVAKREENKGKTVVVLLPDTGDRYLSTELFSEN